MQSKRPRSICRKCQQRGHDLYATRGSLSLLASSNPVETHKGSVCAISVCFDIAVCVCVLWCACGQTHVLLDLRPAAHQLNESLQDYTCYSWNNSALFIPVPAPAHAHSAFCYPFSQHLFLSVRVSFGGASRRTWCTRATGTKSVSSTKWRGTGVSHVDCRSAWMWACLKSVSTGAGWFLWVCGRKGAS